MTRIHLVASRRDALESCESAASAAHHGPVLITGEPGAGKTSLGAPIRGGGPDRLANRER